MGKFIDLTGQTFGYLKVVRRAPNKIYRCPSGNAIEVRWICECSGTGASCKGITEVATNGLRDKTNISCGCMRSFKENAPINWLFASYRDKHGRFFDLTFERFTHLIRSDCHYCGKPPSQTLLTIAPAHSDFRWNGVDRIDNDGDYVDGNVVPCCGEM